MLQFDKEAITSMCKCLAKKMYHTVLGIAKKKKNSDIKTFERPKILKNA